MKALSIRQPWAWLICRPDLTDRPSLPTANPSASGALPLARPTGEGQGEGSFPPSTRAAALAAGELKTIENRDWSTNFRGPFLIHAAQCRWYRHRKMRSRGATAIAAPAGSNSNPRPSDGRGQGEGYVCEASDGAAFHANQSMDPGDGPSIATHAKQCAGSISV